MWIPATVHVLDTTVESEDLEYEVFWIKNETIKP